MPRASGSSEVTPSASRATSMANLPSDFDSWTSNALQDEAMAGNAECASDDEFVHIHLTSSEKCAAMAALSSILSSEKDHSSIEGDWVALSSPTIKVQALEDSKSPLDSSVGNSANTAARDFAGLKIWSYKNLRTSSTDSAPGIDPTKRETYLSEAEFLSLFGLSKTQFYALPTWKQAQQKLDLDLF